MLFFPRIHSRTQYLVCGSLEEGFYYAEGLWARASTPQEMASAARATEAMGACALEDADALPRVMAMPFSQEQEEALRIALEGQTHAPGMWPLFLLLRRRVREAEAACVKAEGEVASGRGPTRMEGLDGAGVSLGRVKELVTAALASMPAVSHAHAG